MDDVQPVEGQGTEPTGGLFDSYLQAVPDEARETVTSYLKDAEKNVNERLQEASQIKKQWEPYQEVELSDYSPEDLSQILAWHRQVSASPDAFQQWLREAAPEAGLTLAEAQELEEEVSEGNLDKATVQQLVEEQAQKLVGPLQERQEAFEQERNIDLEQQAIVGELSRLEKAEGLKLDEKDRAMVIDLGLPAAVDSRGNDLPPGDVSWLPVGLERFKEISNAGARLFVQSATTQPQQPAVTVGGSERMKPITTFADANQAVRERFKAQAQT